MACKTTETGVKVLEFRKIDSKRARKGYRFEWFEILGSSIAKLFDPDTAKDGLSEIKDFITSEVFRAKIKNLDSLSDYADNPLVADLLESDLAPDEIGDKIKERSIIFYTIASATKSEADLAVKHGLSPRDIDKIRDKNGIFYVPTLGLYEAIGRKLLLSYGAKLPAADPDTVSIMARQIGERYVKRFADETNLIEIVDDGVFNARGIKIGDKQRHGLVKGQVLKINYGEDAKAAKRFMDTVSDSIVYDPTELDGSASKISDAFLISRNIHRISQPTNAEMPDTIGSRPKSDVVRDLRDAKKELKEETSREKPDEKKVSSLEDLVQSLEEELRAYPAGFKQAGSIEDEVRYKMNESAPVANGVFFDIMDYLHKLMVEKGQPINKIIDSISAKYLKSPEAGAAMFGNTMWNERTPFNSESVAGRRITKVGDLANNIEAWKQLKNGELHFKHFFIKTGRMYVLETIMNYQANNHSSRPLVAGREYTVNLKENGEYTDQAKLYLMALSDATKIPIGSILYEGNDKALDDAIELFKSAFVDKRNAERQLAFINLIYKDDKYKHLRHSKGAWHTVNNLKAIYDVRSVSDLGVMKSQWLPELDAMSSGPVLTLFQNIGKVADAGKMMADLGIVKSRREPVYRDFYDILEKEITLDRNDRLMESWKKDMQDLLDYNVFGGTSQFGSLRDVFKMPTMKKNYFQGQKNFEKEFGKAVTEAVFEAANTSKDIFKMLKEHLSEEEEIQKSDIDLDSFDSFYTFNKNLSDRQKALVYSVLTDRYGKGMGGAMYEILNKHIDEGYLKEQNQLLDEIFSLFKKYTRKSGKAIKTLAPINVFENIDTIYNQDGTINQAEYEKLVRKYGTDLMKDEEVVGDTEEPYLKKDMRANRPSLSVNMVHLLDSSVLMKALNDTFGTVDVNYGVLAIHDAVMSDPTFMLKFQENYVKAVLEMSKNYDIVQVLLAEAKRLGATQEEIDAIAGRNNVEAKINMIEMLMKDGEVDYSRVGSDKIFGFDLSKFDPGEKPSNPEGEKTSEKTAEKTKEEKVTVASPKESSPTHGSPRQQKSTVRSKYEKAKWGFDSQEKSPFGPKANYAANIEEANRRAIDYMRDMGAKVTDEAKKKFFEQIDALKAIRDGTAKKVNVHYSDRFEVAIGKDQVDLYFDMDKKSSRVGSIATPNQIVEYMSHEMTHAINARWIKKNMDSREVKYIRKVMDSVSKKFNSDPSNKEKFPYLAKAVSYFTSENLPSDAQIAEFVAMFDSESDVRNELKEFLDGTTGSQSWYRQLLEAIRSLTEKALNAMIDGKLGDFKLDVSTIPVTMAAIESINKKALEPGPKEPMFDFRKTELSLEPKKRKFTTKELMDYKEYSPNDARGYDLFMAQQTVTIADEFLRRILFDETRPSAAGLVIKTGQSLDQYARANYPMYERVVDSILNHWDSNKFMLQMQGWLGGSDKLKLDRNNIVSAQEMIEQEKRLLDSEWVYKMDNVLKNNFTKDEQELVYDVFAETPLFTLFEEPETLERILDSGDLDSEISSIEKGSPSRIVKMAKEMADHLAGDFDPLVPAKAELDYTFEPFGNNKDLNKKFALLTTLYMLKKRTGSIDIINKIKNDHKELYNDLRTVSLGLKAISDSVYLATGDAKVSRANLVTDIYEHPKDLRAVSYEEWANDGFSEELGWEVVRKPTEKTLGIVARNRNASYMSGAGTTGGYEMNDVYYKVIGNSNIFGSINHAAEIDMNGRKVVKMFLTKKEKEKLGLIKNAPKSIVRTLSHLEAIKQSEHIRQWLIENQRLVVENESDAKDIVEMIDAGKDEHPFFIKTDIPYSELPSRIKAKYEPIGKGKRFGETAKATRIGGFSDKVSLVRKDVAPWLMGYKNPEIFENSQVARQVGHLVKSMVAMTKMGMAVVNPLKIMKDMSSNISILYMRGVPILKIAKYGKEAMEDLADLSRLRSQIVAKRLELMADPKNDTLKKEYDSLIERQKNHSMAPILYNGMIQSISTDLVMKDYDSVTGLQADIERFLNKLGKDESGNLNDLSRVVMAWAKWGVGMEDALQAIANITDRIDNSEQVGKYIRNMAKEIEGIKKNEDIAKYISQYIAAPDSVATKLGSLAVQSTDVVARTILYRHLRDSGMSEKKAVMDALESFIDYKINMPPALKLASDYFLVPFPSFWMRIQKIDWNLITKSPVHSGMTVVLDEALFGNLLSTPFGANLINKFDNGQIISSPMDAFEAENFMPWMRAVPFL